MKELHFGVWDGNSWRNYLPMKGRTDYPLLFDRSFKPKPAYFMLRDLVRESFELNLMRQDYINIYFHYNHVK